ncbi:hypothetical protein GCM10010168_15760 [Actinoplanes ianthinogenes]|uniref:Uncharacterized protein n=1 Tax=Actinoplanes ianthinogenes TaxID=122358 RepID=A0ABM7LZL1_9ACTN|nr:hypothetical protein [Actinoplanes ianthinogenes]BCJ44763.1 hypothetical protein Aiant_54200 [Actinoplanes ianthinogenes]GGQ99820.1 hypothetical protein GCM10010168_15760 [Actinoplanes ianthinogenes]
MTDSPDTSPDTGSAAPAAPAPRRRRPLVIGLGVLALVVLALVTWVATRPTDVTSTRDVALRGILTYGGPDRWDVTAQPDEGPTQIMKFGEQGEFDGEPVLLSDDGFVVIWSTPVVSAESCTALANWAGRRVAPEAEQQVVAGCGAAVGRPAGDVATIATYTVETGQYTFVAWSGPTGLYAALIYTAPGASSAPNALR